MYKTIDLCAGISGIRKGFERTRHFYNVLSAEIDEYAARTYEYNFGDDPRADLTSEEFKTAAASCQYDVLLAGFPCQPFSSQGNLEGFNDPTKGTIFFHIKEIIEQTRPKAVFLENVQNIVAHNNGETIQIIISTLEDTLNYKVVGVSYDEEGNYVFNNNSFIRNTKNFGLPQNRPRAYFVAFDRDLYGELINLIDDELPDGLNDRLMHNNHLNHTLEEILEPEVDIHYYLSETYLRTLERHAIRQRNNGNGFGYYILNNEEHHRVYANTILATGGSGKERNLVIQTMPEHTEEEERALRKKGGLNHDNIRMMTPTEWGRLQGFIGYGFINELTGEDEFGFPDNVPEGQQYKQFGNSVSISVVETMADYLYEQLQVMNQHYEVVLRNLAQRTGYINRRMICDCLDVSGSRASYILNNLRNANLIVSEGSGRTTIYRFV